MAIQLTQQQKALFAETRSIKVLTTVDASGAPHAQVDDAIYLAEDGTIIYLELLETSTSNRNLVNAIWFGRPVSVLVKGPGEMSFQVTGRPVKVHITGPIFEKHYVEVRRQLGDVDLSGVWVIEPESINDENFWRNKEKEESKRPFFRHLDRLARSGNFQNN